MANGEGTGREGNDLIGNYAVNLILDEYLRGELWDVRTTNELVPFKVTRQQNTTRTYRRCVR